MRFNKQSNGKKLKLLKMISMMVLAFVILIPSFSFAAETSSSTSKVENVVTQPKKLSRTKRSVVASTVPDSVKPTLEGCEFGVYADEDCTHKLDTVVIKKNSDGTYSGVNKGGETLPAGKLYVKELKAATGYKLNTNVYPVNIQAGQEIPLTINNELDVVEPVIAKTSDVQKIKSASLKNPQYVKYTVTMRNPSSTAMVANYVLQDEVQNPANDFALIERDSVVGDINGETFTSFESITKKGFKTNPVVLKPNQTLTVHYTVKITGRLGNTGLKNALFTNAPVSEVYKIDTSVEHGTIDPNIENIDGGSTKTINYAPDTGYQIKSVTVDGQEVNTADHPASYEFANIDSNHKIHVVYEPAPKVENPTKTFDKQVYHDGEKVESTIVASQTGIEGSVAKDVVIADASNDTLKFDLDSVSAKIVGNHGSSEPVITKDEATGGFRVTIAEFKGGDAVNVKVNGKAITKNEKIVNDATVTALGKTNNVHAEATSVYKIDTKVVNGTITDSMKEVARGSDKDVKYSPKEGYHLKSVTVDGQEVDKTQFENKYSFANITANHKIEVVYEGTNAPKIEKHFDKSEYKIGETILNTIIFRNDGVKDAIIKNLVIADQNKEGVKIDTSSIEVNYTGSGNPIVKVIDAATGKFNVFFDEFRGGDQVTIKFKSIFEKNAEKVENDADATGDNIEKITAHAEATPKYEVITEVVNGTISPNVEVKKGENAKIEYAPNDGYKLKKVTVDGNVVTDHPENYDFTNISDNHKIKVEYEAIPRPTITKSFDKANYKVGDVIKATVTVKETGNAGAVSHGVLVTDANQTGFKIKTDTIKATVSKSTERTSSDEPKVTVKDADKGIFEVGLDSIDSSQTLTITYDMEITRESGDIKNKANLKTTEYPKDIPSEATGKVTFDVATKVTGGKITPPVNDVPFGTDVVINYTPDENHYLEKISIDGKEVKTDKIEKSYTFKKIENNHKIEVVYKKLPTPKLEKKSDKADYIKGDVAKYTVTLTNGDALAENVVLKDIFEKEKIDAGVMQLDKDSIKIDGKKVNYAESYNFEKLEAGQKVVLTYEAKVLKDEDNSVRNEASVIAKGMDKEIKVNNTVKIHEIPKLKIEKKSDKKSYKVNEVAKYTITVRNDGKFDAHNVSVKDKFAQEGLMEIQKDTVMVNGKAVSFDKLSVESLKAGDTMTITYSAKVLKDVNAEVVNTATATADYMEYVVDGNGNKVVKNPPTATNKVNIEKTPVKPSLVKTGDATRVLSYGVILLGSALALIITMRRRKAVK